MFFSVLHKSFFTLLVCTTIIHTKISSIIIMYFKIEIFFPPVSCNVLRFVITPDLPFFFLFITFHQCFLFLFFFCHKLTWHHPPRLEGRQVNFFFISIILLVNIFSFLKKFKINAANLSRCFSGFYFHLFII